MAIFEEHRHALNRTCLIRLWRVPLIEQQDRGDSSRVAPWFGSVRHEFGRTWGNSSSSGRSRNTVRWRGEKPDLLRISVVEQNEVVLAQTGGGLTFASG